MCPDISHICVIILAGAEQPSLTWNSNQSDASIQCNTYNEIRQSPNTWSCPSHQASHAEPRSEPLSEPRRAPTTDHVDHVPSSSVELRPRITSTTSRAAPPSSDHVDRDHVDHVPSSSAELRPPRPQDYVPMMIAAKNGATTIVTTVMTTGQKARGLDNFIANDTSSHLSNIATRRLHPPVINKAKYYF